MKRFYAYFLFCILAMTLACNSDAEGNRNANRSGSNANQVASGHDQMDHSKMNHNQSNAVATNANQQPMMDHSSMDHSAMQSSPDAKSAPFDLQFLDTMIGHHEGAVVMAKPAVDKAENQELKNLAQAIIRDQEKEIAQMREWREKWFAGKPLAMNMEMPGMADSMKGMDMKRLGSLSGKQFDQAFVEMMIPHHEGAITMAKDALERAEHAEIKTLAQAIIMAQEAEIKTMRGWQKN